MHPSIHIFDETSLVEELHLPMGATLFLETKEVPSLPLSLSLSLSLFATDIARTCLQVRQDGTMIVFPFMRVKPEKEETEEREKEEEEDEKKDEDDEEPKKPKQKQKEKKSGGKSNGLCPLRVDANELLPIGSPENRGGTLVKDDHTLKDLKQMLLKLDVCKHAESIHCIR